MNAKYIIRLDDACPTMNKDKWSKIEKILDKYNIKPIIAVIPNNKDTSMIVDEYDSTFWKKVKNWQKKGYYIALHGYEHLYVTQNSGLIPFNKQSEFAGLSFEEQSKKIKEGWEIFKKHDIKTNIWVAPSHTFDKNTLKALKQETSISIISDGIGLNPFIKNGFKWIPQQLWRFKNMPFGVWTICLHPNTMSDMDIKQMGNFIKENKNKFVLVDEIKYKSCSLFNILFKIMYWSLFKIKKAIK